MSLDRLEPVTLCGCHVHLVPLSLDHAEDLSAAVQDGELWRLWFTNIPSPDGMAGEIERRLDLQRAGFMLPFAVIQPDTNKPIGMTTYMSIDAPNRRLEIGYTWYAASFQRTALNTEAKLLLLGHAFEALGCIAVEFRTHFMNQASRRAIERIGAKLDGILRSHAISRNGTLRDTCVYSIIASEWPAVRAHLEGRLARPRPA